MIFNPRAGVLVTQLSGYKAFIPSSLPPNPPLVIDDELSVLIEQSALAVGRLAGITAIIPDPDLFVYLYVRKEALLSSQIEGTQCSLEDILNLDPDAIDEQPAHAEIEEVTNYIRAMNEGLQRLNTLPLSSRLLREIHETLMTGVRGYNKTPGEFRRSQNWIGRPGGTLTNAEFVPPPPDEVPRLMAELEAYIHSTDRIPPLVKTALIHAHFETIHPFLDGNGRLGRLLITYLFCVWKILDKPLLYISYFFKANRSEYYARLMGVRQRGEWESWVKFFLKAVKESAETATVAAVEINTLHKIDRERIRLAKPTSAAILAFEQFCHDPIMSNTTLVERLKQTKPTVQKALTSLCSLGIIQEISGKKRGRRYAYSAYLAILTRDTITEIG